MQALKLDEHGLIPAVAQDRTTGVVRMVAWMNAEALRVSEATGYATFYSRSRGRLWTKGEASGNKLKIHRIVADCDGDTLLLLVEPSGPSCHTGRESCFFTPIALVAAARESASESTVPVQSTEARDSRSLGFHAEPFLFELERTLKQRLESTSEKSYTRSLLEAGPDKVGAKVSEEAGELAVALKEESDDRVLAEAADVLYHVLVGLRLRELDLAQVIEVLARRSGVSGHAEKAARKGESTS